MAAEEILRFEDVSLQFEGDDSPAVDRVSFRLAAGETIILFGAAGSGKTVLLKLAVGLLRAGSGRIFMFGREVTHLQEQEWYQMRAQAGVLFQEGGLFDSMTIEENVSYPLLNQKSGIVQADEAHRRVEEVLQFVGLPQTLEKFPSELSGGMRRRVGIARATVTQPRLVLYDSPTAGLDPITANRIIALLIKERELRNTASMIVTHRFQDGHMLATFRYNPQTEKVLEVPPAERQHLNTRFFVMREGRLVFEGSEDELSASTDPYVSKFTMQRA